MRLGEPFNSDEFNRIMRDGALRLAALGKQWQEMMREGFDNLNRTIKDAERRYQAAQDRAMVTRLDEAYRNLTGMGRDEWEEFKHGTRYAARIAAERRQGLTYVRVYAAQVRKEMGLR